MILTGVFIGSKALDGLTSPIRRVLYDNHHHSLWLAVYVLSCMFLFYLTALYLHRKLLNRPERKLAEK